MIARIFLPHGSFARVCDFNDGRSVPNDALLNRDGENEYIAMTKCRDGNFYAFHLEPDRMLARMMNEPVGYFEE